MKSINLFGRDVYPKEDEYTKSWESYCGGFLVNIYQAKEPNESEYSTSTQITVEYFGEDISGDEDLQYYSVESAIEAIKRIIFNFMEEKARVKNWVGYKRY